MLTTDTEAVVPYCRCDNSKGDETVDFDSLEFANLYSSKRCEQRNADQKRSLNCDIKATYVICCNLSCAHDRNDGRKSSQYGTNVMTIKYVGVACAGAKRPLIGLPPTVQEYSEYHYDVVPP